MRVCNFWVFLLAIFFIPPVTTRAHQLPSDTQDPKPAVKTQGHSQSSAEKGADLNRGLERLEKWKFAVRAGDKAALASLYSVAPPAVAITPAGKSSDPNEEPQFWSGLKNTRLSDFDAQILEVVSPQPGAQVLVLRIDGSLQSPEGKKGFYASVSQYWAETEHGWLIVATQRSNIRPLIAPLRLPKPQTSNPYLYPDSEEAEADLATALAVAVRNHKRVLVVFGGNWCYDCHVLDAAFRSKEIAPLVQANYEVVHVNIGEGDRNLDIAKRYEVGLDKGVPSLAVLGSDGKLVTSQKHGEFESAYKIGPEDIIGFLERWKPAPVKLGR